MLLVELQDSYLTSSGCPENFIPSGIATYKTKLSSYKKRLDDAECNLFLIPWDTNINIPVINLATGDGKGRETFTLLGHILPSLAREKKRLDSPDKLTECLSVMAAQVTSGSSALQLIARK